MASKKAHHENQSAKNENRRKHEKSETLKRRRIMKAAKERARKSLIGMAEIKRPVAGIWRNKTAKENQRIESEKK